MAKGNSVSVAGEVTRRKDLIKGATQLWVTLRDGTEGIFLFVPKGTKNTPYVGEQFKAMAHLDRSMGGGTLIVVDGFNTEVR
jgi:hypothetical protein